MPHLPVVATHHVCRPCAVLSNCNIWCPSPRSHFPVPSRGVATNDVCHPVLSSRNTYSTMLSRVVEHLRTRCPVPWNSAQLSTRLQIPHVSSFNTVPPMKSKHTCPYGLFLIMFPFVDSPLYAASYYNRIRAMVMPII